MPKRCGGISHRSGQFLSEVGRFDLPRKAILKRTGLGISEEDADWLPSNTKDNAQKSLIMIVSISSLNGSHAPRGNELTGVP